MRQKLQNSKGYAESPEFLPVSRVSGHQPLARARLSEREVVERFVLASSDCGLKFIRVVNHSAMNNIEIIYAHNLIRLISKHKTGYAKVLLFTLLTTPANQHPPIILGNGEQTALL